MARAFTGWRRCSPCSMPARRGSRWSTSTTVTAPRCWRGASPPLGPGRATRERAARARWEERRRAARRRPTCAHERRAGRAGPAASGAPGVTALPLYGLVATLTLFAVDRFLQPLSRRAALVLLLVPFCL